MKKISAIYLLTLLIFFIPNLVHAQPIPIELMLGNNYGSINMTFTKKFSPESRFGVFHLNSIEFDYDEEYKNSILVKDFIFVETIKNLNLATGAIYTDAGIAAQVGLMYSLKKENFFFLFTPGMNIEKDPVFDNITIFQFTPKINESYHLHARAKFLNVFNADGNLKSYQWIRLGLAKDGWSYGLAIDLSEYGPNPSVETNFGVFVQKEIF